MSEAHVLPEFIGRDREVSQLREAIDRAKPSISVVYGRRRIGKSALIQQALTGRRALFFEGLENQATAKQLDNFVFQLTRQSSVLGANPIPKTWREALILLEPILKQEPACIVLDEFQWMANYRTTLVSDLKMVWEQYLSHIPGVSLVLCGSIASFMLKKVVKSSALYGRTDCVIHLREFSLAESAEMLSLYGLDELLDAYMMFGGVPKYQELVRDHPSLYLAVEDLAFRENGFLVDEFDRIFVSHFGRNDEYERIIAALAHHPYGLTRQELVKTAKVNTGGGLTRNLYDLESAGFIQSLHPIGRAGNTRMIKYSLNDAYLRFYYALMHPLVKTIRSGQSRLRFPELVQRPAFFAWRGRAFELVCAQHAHCLAKALGFSGVEYHCGPFFRVGKAEKKGVQIDLVFDRADHVLTLCEMKCSREPIGQFVINEMDCKAALLREQFPKKTIQNVLVYHGAITEAIEKSGYLYKVLNAEVFLKC